MTIRTAFGTARDRLLAPFTRVDQVFGIGPLRRATYVDRGGLDERLRLGLKQAKHLAIHGDSKHGKSWLRAKSLPDERAARVQCLPGATAARVLEEALGEIGATVETAVREAGGTDAGIQAGTSQAGARVAVHHSHEVESEPIGVGAANAGWAARQFREAGRVPVFEDFHNLSPSEQRNMAFLIKALGEYQLSCVIVGIWGDDHLLTVHDRELVGRIEDLHVRWSGEELARVVHLGGRALNVRISDMLVRSLVDGCRGSVGLLQELAAEALKDAGVEKGGVRTRRLDDPAHTAAAIRRLAERDSPRYSRMIAMLSAGFPETPATRATYQTIFRALWTRFDDQDLVDGVPESAVVEQTLDLDPSTDESVIREALGSLGSLHERHDLSPAIFVYHETTGTVSLADRRLLFCRRHGGMMPWK